METSSRNSEVIHAGIYYPQGSFKARLCVSGKAALYDYCRERDIAHRRTGKLIVAAKDSEREILDRYLLAAERNGVCDLRPLSAADMRVLEPEVACAAALLSPSTGIIDSHALMFHFLTDLENNGGVLVL